ncbi:hypothetical protein AMJ85_04690 [candidate division BRC1 bacterium SM23_51]|nr:MAG: hypothetical protein AMJ85_04690 [candidate division BRC1 bacterium SM23_51]
MRKRDFLFSLLLAVLAFGIVGIFHNFAQVRQTISLLREFREPEASLRLPAAPYVEAFLRITLFYVVAAVATGGVLSLLCSLLTGAREASRDNVREASAEGDKRAGLGRRRHRYYALYCALLVGFLIYVHLRMVTLYPALFRNSYRYAWFAGGATWAFVVWLVGIIALVVVAVALIIGLVRKFAGTPGGKRRRARMATAIVAAAVVVAVGALGYRGLKNRHDDPLVNRGPNIVLLGIDSARPDHISALGYNRPTTPNIDAFLNDAVWFDQAFVPLCRTYPSWAALLTACNPTSNGVRFDLPPRETYVPRVATLAQHLKALGFSTAFFLNNTNYAWTEPSLGFDDIHQPDHNAVDFYLSHVQPKTILYYFFLNNRWGFLYERGLKGNAAYTPIYRPEYFDAEVVEHWRRMRQSKQFLTGIHLCNLHAPLSVNYPYSTYFASVTRPVFNRFTYQILVEEIARRQRGGERFSKQEAERIFTQEINLYDALLRSTDDSVGRILNGLKRAGLYDNSMIVLFSDHGEHLFANGLRYRYRNSNHGNHMWGDGDQHVPLAIKFPHRKHAGQVVKRLVRSIDVGPTILDALGLPPLGGVQGVSLMPYVERRQSDMHLIAYAETGLTLDDFFFPSHLGYSFDDYFDLHYVDDMRIYKKMEYMPNLIMAKDRMIRDEQWKLIVYPVVTDRLTFYYELFDAAADPNNVNDVKTSYPAEVKRLRSLIWPSIMSDWQRFGRGLPAELPVTTGMATQPPPDLLNHLQRSSRSPDSETQQQE